jgi:putative sterol carrier protein
MKKSTTAQQRFLNVAPFIPLTVFQMAAGSGIISSGRLLAGAAVVLACSIAFIFIAHRWDRPGYFDWTVGAYLAGITAALVLWPQPAGVLLARYSVTGIYICLFAAAFLPPLIGLPPFTIHYARRSAPEEVWRNPVFLAINRIMTFAWAGLFAACIVVSLYPSWLTQSLVPLALLLGIGLPFNRRFPDYYLRRRDLPTLREQKWMASEGALAKPLETRPGPLPETAREAIASMPRAFNAPAAQGLRAVIGFVVSGAETFNACLRIEDGTCTFEEQSSRKPDLLIRTPADVWLAMARGEMDPQDGFAAKAYTAEGSLGLLIRMGSIFRGGPAPAPASGPPSADTDAMAFPTDASPIANTNL